MIEISFFLLNTDQDFPNHKQLTKMQYIIFESHMI